MRLKSKERNWRFWFPLLTIALLVGIGLLNLRNADSYSNDSYHYSQIVWVLVGGVMAILVAKIDLVLFERIAWVGYVIAIVLLLLVLLFAKEVNNSRRWLYIFGLSIQPSEPAKLAVILTLARFFQQSRQVERYTLRTLWKPFLILAAPAALILLEPDLGTTLATLMIGFSIILFAGVRLRSLLLLLGYAMLLVPLAWHFEVIRPYQKDRVALWLNPDAFKWDEKRREIMDKNLQPEQALWAIGSGRLAGKGGRQGSRSRLKYLPEMQTDFILATYAEERGFVGCFLLIALFYLVVLWALRLARDARDRFSALVAVGCAALIFWQMFMNVGMVTGLLPVVGITLPFLSYGGSALLTAFFAVGLLFNIQLHMTRR